MNSDFIHRFVPASNVSSSPSLLLLHGTGGNEDDLIEKTPDLTETRVFLASRLSDSFLPIDNARRLVAMLRGARAELTFKKINAGHQLTSAELDVAREWLAAGRFRAE